MSVIEAPARAGNVLHNQPARLMKAPGAARYCGMSVPKFQQLVGDGRLPAALRIDGLVLWDVHQIDAAIDALIYDAEPEPNDDGGGWD